MLYTHRFAPNLIAYPQVTSIFIVVKPTASDGAGQGTPNAIAASNSHHNHPIYFNSSFNVHRSLLSFIT